MPAMETEVNASGRGRDPNDTMQMLAEKLGKVRIRALATVSNNNVVGPQKIVQALHDRQLVVTH